MSGFAGRALLNARLAARGGVMAGWTAGLYVAHLAQERLVNAERWPQTHDRAVKRWARGALSINNIETILADPLPPERAGVSRLVVCNHRAAFDIPILMAHFGGTMLSRHDIADWPLLGTAAKRANCIFVDRDDPKSGVHAVRSIRKRLEAGITVSIFPEGTTYAGDEIREFSRGAIIAARGLEVELLPVALAYPSGSEFIEDEMGDHMRNFASKGRIRVGVAVGRPRTNDSSARKLAASLREDIVSLVQRARRVRG